MILSERQAAAKEKIHRLGPELLGSGVTEFSIRALDKLIDQIIKEDEEAFCKLYMKEPRRLIVTNEHEPKQKRTRDRISLRPKA